ncbi:MAG TPA: DUF3618 domain-containing protein [Solirubrobacteraceae bacterium]|nr:DUF3618 domain-containing protein [Solirubrobacteraceae bacterium]
MGEDPGTVGAPVESAGDPAQGAKDPAQIREEIEATRRELGDTVEALAAKADVKTHVRERVERTKASMPNPVVLGAVAAVAVLGLVAWRVKKR